MLISSDEIRCPTAWSSNIPNACVARKVLGDAGSDNLKLWFEQQVDRVSDPNFAQRFGDKRKSFDVPIEAFNHRMVERDTSRLLAGVRFLGGDASKPFVDLIAWTEIDAKDGAHNWPLIQHIVAAEWAAFRPFALRVFCTTELTLPEGSRIDQTVHAASYRDMAALPTGCSVHVKLERLADATVALRIVRQRYDQLAATEPDLAGRLYPASRNELQESANHGGLFGICSSGRMIGVLSTIVGNVEWLHGDVVLEEVVEPEYAGRNVAAAAQNALAKMQVNNANTLLLGTIDQRNLASRKTAERAGRPVMMQYAFLPLHRQLRS